MLYQARELALPIAVELVRKTVPVYHPKTRKTSYQIPFTKNKYLQQMLRVALPGWPQQQVAYRYLLADSWYASAENMTLVRALGHHFLFALESSRTVALSAAARARGPFPTCAVAGVCRCATLARLFAVRSRGGARK